MLEEMTVTADKDDSGYNRYNKTAINSATRTNTPLKEIPQSIQVITRKVIDDQQNVVVSESLRNVSGLVTNNVLFTPAADKTRIRGFAAEQLLDGFTQYYNPGDRESTVNLERVEVLKGSNAVLYSGGSGSPVGGVVNLVSKLPSADKFGQLGFKIGSENFYQPYVDINQPINDNILFRFTGEFTDAGSYIDTVHTERYNINPVLTFTDNDKTTLTLQGRLARWRQQDYQGLPATGTVAGDFKLNPELFIGPDNLPPSYSEFDGLWGTLDHKLNNVWSFNLKARYAESKFDQKAKVLSGADGLTADRPIKTAANKSPATWWYTNSELYQEQTETCALGNALAEFDLGATKNKLLIGADYSEYADSGFIGTGASSNTDPFAFTQIDLLKPNFSIPWARPQIGNNGNIQFVNNTTYGGYVQLQSNWAERLHVLFSVRAGVVDIDYRNRASFPRRAEQSSTLKFLPRAGIVFDLTKELSLFVNYSEGMRGQPFVNFSGTPKPALSDSLEGGIKFNFNDKFTGQLAAYRIDRSNVAVTNLNDVDLLSLTAGKQRSFGFEADLTWQPVSGLDVLANYAYTHAEYTNNINFDSKFNANSVLEGSKVAGVPEHSTRVWANYEFQQPLLRGLSVGAGMYWQSATFLSDRNLFLPNSTQVAFKSDSYYTMDAVIAYRFQRYKVAASVKNLTNEQYFQRFGYFDGHVVPAQGTSAYVTFSMDY